MGSPMTPDHHAIIRERVHPGLHHLIADETELRDLQIGPIEMWAILFDLEVALDRAIDPDPTPGWQTVGDVGRIER